MAPQHNREDKVQYSLYDQILDVTLRHAIQLAETPYAQQMFCYSRQINNN